MKSTQTIYLLLILILLGLTSITNANNNLKGLWHIETVIVENDTLYHKAQRHLTSKFYNSRIKGWPKSKSDEEYVDRCLNSTFWSLKNSYLNFDKLTHTQTDIKPCWDHMDFDGVSEGKYINQNDSIRLFNLKNELYMLLTYDTKRENLYYSNVEFNFQIVYAKGKNE